MLVMGAEWCRRQGPTNYFRTFIYVDPHVTWPRSPQKGGNCQLQVQERFNPRKMFDIFDSQYSVSVLSVLGAAPPASHSIRNRGPALKCS